MYVILIYIYISYIIYITFQLQAAPFSHLLKGRYTRPAIGKSVQPPCYETCLGGSIHMYGKGILSNGHHVSKLQVNVSTPGRSIFPSAQRKVHTAYYRQKCATTQLFLTHSVPSRPHRLVADMATQPRESSPASEILRGQGPKGKTRPLRQ